MSNTLIVILVFGFTILLIITGIYLAIWYENKRTESLRIFATDKGFIFEGKADSTQALGLPLTELFKRGRDKQTTNTMIADIEGSKVHVLDFCHTVGSGRHSSIQNQTVIAIPAGITTLPNFTLAPDNIFHKISRPYSYQDIDIEHDPEFSSLYLLRGEDEKAIRNLFNQRVINTYRNRLRGNVEVCDGWLFVFNAGKRLKPVEIQPRIENAFAFLFELRGM